MTSLPKGTRTDIILWPGTMDNLTLTWVETGNEWLCYTTLPGLNQYGRVDMYDVVTSDEVFRLIADIYDSSRVMDESDRLAFKARIRARAGAPTWGADKSDTPDEPPKSSTWGPWGQDGRQGN